MTIKITFKNDPTCCSICGVKLTDNLRYLKKYKENFNICEFCLIGIEMFIEYNSVSYSDIFGIYEDKKCDFCGTEPYEEKTFGPFHIEKKNKDLYFCTTCLGNHINENLKVIHSHKTNNEFLTINPYDYGKEENKNHDKIELSPYLEEVPREWFGNFTLPYQYFTSHDSSFIFCVNCGRENVQDDNVDFIKLGSKTDGYLCANCYNIIEWLRQKLLTIPSKNGTNCTLCGNVPRGLSGFLVSLPSKPKLHICNKCLFPIEHITVSEHKKISERTSKKKKNYYTFENISIYKIYPKNTVAIYLKKRPTYELFLDGEINSITGYLKKIETQEIKHLKISHQKNNINSFLEMIREASKNENEEKLLPNLLNDDFLQEFSLELSNESSPINKIISELKQMKSIGNQLQTLSTLLNYKEDKLNSLIPEELSAETIQLDPSSVLVMSAIEKRDAIFPNTLDFYNNILTLIDTQTKEIIKGQKMDPTLQIENKLNLLNILKVTFEELKKDFLDYQDTWKLIPLTPASQCQCSICETTYTSNLNFFQSKINIDFYICNSCHEKINKHIMYKNFLLSDDSEGNCTICKILLRRIITRLF
jgi:hypothetical protein